MNGTVTISINDYNALLTQAHVTKEKYDILIGKILGDAEIIGDKGKEFLYFSNLSTVIRDTLKAIEPDKYEKKVACLVKEKEIENEKNTELPL